MILSIKNLSHSFGDVTIFKDLNFEWPKKSKTIGVLGPNGSGKSTLFKIISGELYPDKGNIFFKNEDITSLEMFKRNRKGISKTFQIPSPFEGMTIFENVYLGTIESRDTENIKKERTNILLEKFKLIEKSALCVNTLNVMDLRLLEMARAFATNPKLILLDECMVGFTNQEINDFLYILTSIQNEENIHIMMIEHNISIMEKFCNHMIVLHLGNIVIQGTPKNCFSNPIIETIYTKI